MATVGDSAFTWSCPIEGTQHWYVVARNAAGSVRAPETGTWSFIGCQSTLLTGNVTIAQDDFSYDHKPLLKDGGTLTLDGSHTFANLILTNGAVLTHPACTAAETHGLDLTIHGALMVSSDSAIDAGGRGYLAGWTHPNTTNGASTYRSGGSYGGLGGNYPSGRVNAPYGDFRNPNEPGSGAYLYGAGGGNRAGGGLVRIVTGSLELEGAIRANGQDGDYGRGSGGGIYLEVGRLSGGGIVEAVGGRNTASVSSSFGGGGGGGRIAIYYDELDGFDLSNRVSAAGGKGENTSSYDGATGTVYLEKAGGTGELIIDRKTGGGGTSWIWMPEGAATYAGDLKISGAMVVEQRSANFMPTNLYLVNGAVLKHPACTTASAYSLNLIVPGRFCISSDSAIDAGGRGYLAGRTHPNTTNGASTYRSGGSYGGLGGNYPSGRVNAPYGDFRNPNEPGSGAYLYGAGGGNRAGGGLVRIVTGSLELEGAIRANGQDGDYGRGSGGGIYLEVGRLSGGGIVEAVGGRNTASVSSSFGGGGGGGRIAIYYDELDGFDLSNRVSAAGGKGENTSSYDGATGTVYLEKAGGTGELIIDRKTGGGGTSWIWMPEGAATYAGDLKISGAMVVEQRSANFMPTNLYLVNGAVLKYRACTATTVYSLDLNVPGRLCISSDSAIDAGGRGYLGGRTHPNTTNGASTGRAGGSYGGLGGNYSSGRANAPYGDFRNPNEPGSGAYLYGAGGGNQAGGVGQAGSIHS